MGRKTLDTIIDAYHSEDPTYVSFFNNGETMQDGRSINDKMSDYYYDDMLYNISYYFKNATQYYAKGAVFDQIDMKLKLGLVYKYDDVDENGKIKESAEPIKNIARCYLDRIDSYLDGEKVNKRSFSMYNTNGFVNYNKLVSYVKDNKLNFVGPENFELFKNAILSGNNFDVEVSANLGENKEKVSYNNNRQKALRKIPFFKRGR